MSRVTGHDTLEERLANHETVEQARNLIAAYARAVDGKDLAGLEAIFARDAVISSKDRSWNGRDEILAFFRRAFETAPCPRRHFITNVATSNATPHSVDATSYFLYVTADGGQSIIGWGSYEDRFAQRDGRLVLQAKRIAVDVAVGLDEGWAAVLAVAAPGTTTEGVR